MPDNEICRFILDAIDNPLLSSSLPGDGEVETYTDPEVMQETFGHEVDFVIDGGFGGMIPSTIVDCTSGEWVVTREGKGSVEMLS